MYYLNIRESDKRVLSATFEQYSLSGSVSVETLPQGNISDYLYEGGTFRYSPLEKSGEVASEFDKLEAQVTYTAMMTDTLLPKEDENV